MERSGEGTGLPALTPAQEAAYHALARALGRPVLMRQLAYCRWLAWWRCRPTPPACQVGTESLDAVARDVARLCEALPPAPGD